jgi:hypothetical protein
MVGLLISVWILGCELRTPETLLMGPGYAAVGYQLNCKTSGQLEVTCNQQQFLLDTRISEPGVGIRLIDGANPPRQVDSDGWTFETKTFRIRRQLKKHANRIEVTDTITNRTGELQGLFYSIDSKQQGTCYLGGHETHRDSNLSQPEFPVLQLKEHNVSLGIVPRDDVFRNQSILFRRSGRAGVRTENLGIAAGGTTKLCWEAYPFPSTDPFELANRVRQSWGTAAHTMTGLFGFVYPQYKFRGQYLADMNDSQIKDWVKSSGLSVVCFVVEADTNDPSQRRGRPWAAIEAFGEDYLNAKSSKDYWQPIVNKIRIACPQVKVIPYFHLGVNPDDPKLTETCNVLGSGVKTFTNYVGIKRSYYWAANGNEFQKIVERVWSATCEEFGQQGIYWDEYGHGDQARYLLDADWDGASVQMDLASGRVIKKITNYTLSELPLRRKLVDSLIAGDQILFANFEPTTLEENASSAVHFVECVTAENAPRGYLGNPLGCCNAGLSTPAELVKDIIHNLDLGLATALIGPAAYLDFVRSPLSYCYPLTPREIHAGWILGDERIITSRSGRFGWRDASIARLILVNSDGRVEIGLADCEKINGHSWYSVKLSTGQFAILERKRGGTK